MASRPSKWKDAFNGVDEAPEKSVDAQENNPLAASTSVGAAVLFVNVQEFFVNADGLAQCVPRVNVVGKCGAVHACAVNVHEMGPALDEKDAPVDEINGRVHAQEFFVHATAAPVHGKVRTVVGQDFFVDDPVSRQDDSAARVDDRSAGRRS